MSLVAAGRLLVGARPIPALWGPFTFPVDEAAPIVTPHIETNAIGGITVTDTGNKVSIANGKLLVAGPVGAGDPRLRDATGLARIAGRAFRATWTPGPLTNNVRDWRAGWHNSSTPSANPQYTIGAASNSSVRLQLSGNAIMLDSSVIPAWLNGVPYELTVILRSAGGALYVRDSKLLWLTDNTNTATMYATIQAQTATVDDFVGAFQRIRVVDLPAPWDTDFGLATTRLAGARAAGDAFVHMPNVFLGFILTTLPASGSIQVRYREVDANNYMQTEINSAGDLAVVQCAAGVPTTKISSLAVAANGNRIITYNDGAAAQLFCSNLGNGDRGSTTGLTVGLTATAGRIVSLGVGGAVSDLIAWPIDVAVPF